MPLSDLKTPEDAWRAAFACPDAHRRRRARQLDHPSPGKLIRTAEEVRPWKYFAAFRGAGRFASLLPEVPPAQVGYRRLKNGYGTRQAQSPMQPPKTNRRTPPRAAPAAWALLSALLAYPAMSWPQQPSTELAPLRDVPRYSFACEDVPVQSDLDLVAQIRMQSIMRAPCRSFPFTIALGERAHIEHERDRRHHFQGYTSAFAPIDRQNLAAAIGPPAGDVEPCVVLVEYRDASFNEQRHCDLLKRFLARDGRPIAGHVNSVAVSRSRSLVSFAGWFVRPADSTPTRRPFVGYLRIRNGKSTGSFVHELAVGGVDRVTPRTIEFVGDRMLIAGHGDTAKGKRDALLLELSVPDRDLSEWERNPPSIKWARLCGGTEDDSFVAMTAAKGERRLGLTGLVGMSLASKPLLVLAGTTKSKGIGPAGSPEAQYGLSWVLVASPEGQVYDEWVLPLASIHYIAVDLEGHLSFAGFLNRNLYSVGAARFSPTRQRADVVDWNHPNSWTRSSNARGSSSRAAALTCIDWEVGRLGQLQIMDLREKPNAPLR